jgi:hypothetical protein
MIHPTWGDIGGAKRSEPAGLVHVVRIAGAASLPSIRMNDGWRPGRQIRRSMAMELSSTTNRSYYLFLKGGIRYEQGSNDGKRYDYGLWEGIVTFMHGVFLVLDPLGASRS